MPLLGGIFHTWKQRRFSWTAIPESDSRTNSRPNSAIKKSCPLEGEVPGNRARGSQEAITCYIFLFSEISVASHATVER
jgi:hypothetical protein